MVSATRKGDYLVEATAGSFQILSDVKSDLGGKDLGPNPHELLEAALASCTVMTVQMYANRKGWPLVSTDVSVRTVKEGLESTISREISFRGDLSNDQKLKLLEIADKCPVHRLLVSKITIETQALG